MLKMAENSTTFKHTYVPQDCPLLLVTAVAEEHLSHNLGYYWIDSI